MKVAVISFDVKYIENLKNIIKQVEIIPYRDTISFLKEFEASKPDLIIYDTTSGIFAEDDIKYLLTRGVIDNKRIMGLTSPENPIDTEYFQSRVIFFDKFKQIDEVVSFINSMVDVKPTQIQEDKIGKQKVIPEHREEVYEIVTSDVTPEFEIEPIDLDIQEIEKSVKIEQSPQLEPAFQEIELKEEEFQSIDFDYGYEMEKPKEAVKIETPLEIEFSSLEMPEIPKETKQEVIEIPKIKNTQRIGYSSTELQSLKETLTPKVEPANQVVEIKETPQIKKTSEFFKEYFQKRKQEELSKGVEIMVANFNIQITDQELKNLALQIARNFLEKDRAMEKIVDYLQIDFQEETRKELDKLKQDLKEQLRKEFQEKMSSEIERLIKEELKDFVAEITARIVKEKIDRVFRSF
ncbi:MAG: hypothetical protein N2Z80_00670 [Hydrogenothermaceae bacterium]|nr:hypothetical protein [Hydrogenothermaceae bacterium]